LNLTVSSVDILPGLYQESSFLVGWSFFTL